MFEHIKIPEEGNTISFGSDDKIIVPNNPIIPFIEGDGIGFDISLKTDSSGMETMKSRAVLINADYKIVSEIGKGTQLYLSYPYKSTK